MPSGLKSSKTSFKIIKNYKSDEVSKKNKKNNPVITVYTDTTFLNDKSDKTSTSGNLLKIEKTPIFIIRNS